MGTRLNKSSFYGIYNYKEKGEWENCKWKVFYLPELCVLAVLHSRLYTVQRQTGNRKSGEHH